MTTLSDIILVNEGNNPDALGSIDVFETVEFACNYVEPWFVKKAYLAFTADGRTVRFKTDGKNTFAHISDEQSPDNEQVVRTWLEHCAHVTTRRYRLDVNIEQASAQELLSHITFTK